MKKKGILRNSDTEDLTMAKYAADENRYSSMEYACCGDSGLKLPKISLGLWHNFGSYDNFENMRRMCFTAFDNGITHFDLANNYGPAPGSAETNFGRILKDDMASYRDEMIISTKAGYDMWEGPYGDGGSRKYLLASLDQSLKRMGLEYVDIFYHHRMTPETPLEETMLALSQAVKSGKALYVGISNYDGENMKKASAILSELKVPFVINQNRYNIFDRTVEENGLLAAAKEEKKGVICFSPLDQGILSDRYLTGIPKNSRAAKNVFLHEDTITEELLKKVVKLNNIAADRGQTLAQTALSWVLKNDAVTSVLVGASSPKQILDSVGCLENSQFSGEELAAIDAVCND